VAGEEFFRRQSFGKLEWVHGVIVEKLDE
jgi:hypothetical protein